MYTLGANTTNHVQAIVEDVFPAFQKLISALTFPEGVCIGNKCHKRRGRSKQFLNEAVRIGCVPKYRTSTHLSGQKSGGIIS